VKGIAEQVGSISKMAWENRMALEMILAEKVGGGLCPDWGKCCTFIHNNRAPDGTITKALQSLTALSKKLTKNSGINDPLTNWLEQWFRKWKGVMTSILTSFIAVFGAMALIGCCVIPCIQGLILRFTETALTKQTPVSYQLLLNTAKIEGQ
jgi:hypothetical protein